MKVLCWSRGAEVNLVRAYLDDGRAGDDLRLLEKFDTSRQWSLADVELVGAEVPAQAVKDRRSGRAVRFTSNDGSKKTGMVLGGLPGGMVRVKEIVPAGDGMEHQVPASQIEALGPKPREEFVPDEYVAGKLGMPP